MEELPQDGIWIYGVGEFGHRVSSLLTSTGFSVSGFIDAGARSPLRTPKWVPLDSWDGIGSTVVLGVLNPYADLGKICEDLMERGAARVVTPVQLSQLMEAHGVRLQSYWLTPDYSSRVDLIDVASKREMLGDAESKNVFDRVLRYRILGEVADAGAASSLAEQYNPQDLQFATSGMRLIDGGAFTGDTIRALLEWGVALEAVLAFEPDLSNFAHLSSLLAGRIDVDSIALPMALGSTPAQITWLAGSGPSARVVTSDAEGPSITVALDSVAPRWSPSHVKLDIEGAELEALQGMRGTLRSCRPHLAVSCYHTPEHHWEILDWLAEQDLDYRFYMRNHGQQTFDTVLYCIPESW